MHERIAYMSLPIGWDIYWALRNGTEKYTLRDAQELMVKSGYGQFNCSIFELRQAELYTAMTIPCECHHCLHNISAHTPPISILSAEVYNAREKTGFYWK